MQGRAFLESSEWPTTFKGSNFPKTAKTGPTLWYFMRRFDENIQWRHTRMTLCHSFALL